MRLIRINLTPTPDTDGAFARARLLVFARQSLAARKWLAIQLLVIPNVVLATASAGAWLCMPACLVLSTQRKRPLPNVPPSIFLRSFSPGSSYTNVVGNGPATSGSERTVLHYQDQLHLDMSQAAAGFPSQLLHIELLSLRKEARRCQAKDLQVQVLFRDVVLRVFTPVEGYLLGSSHFFGTWQGKYPVQQHGRAGRRVHVTAWK